MPHSILGGEAAIPMPPPPYSPLRDIAALDNGRGPGTSQRQRQRLGDRVAPTQQHDSSMLQHSMPEHSIPTHTRPNNGGRIKPAPLEYVCL